MTKRKVVYQISDDGFIVERFPVSTNEYGEIIDELDEDITLITMDIPQSKFHTARWNGQEWIEGATQEEIDEMTKVEPQPPTELELLKERLAITEQALVDLILGGM